MPVGDVAHANVQDIGLDAAVLQNPMAPLGANDLAQDPKRWRVRVFPGVDSERMCAIAIPAVDGFRQPLRGIGAAQGRGAVILLFAAVLISARLQTGGVRRLLEAGLPLVLQSQR